MKEKMKEKMIFSKKCFTKRAQMKPKMFRKKNPLGTNISSIFLLKVQNLTVFFNYLVETNSIFRAGGIKSEGVRDRTVCVCTCNRP